MPRPGQRVNLYGFTLVEVLIVMMVFAIMGATVLPQFTAENHEAQEAALRQDLKLLRSQIELYKFQHNGNYPGKGSIYPDDFLNAMLLSSDADGTTGLDGLLPQAVHNHAGRQRVVRTGKPLG